MLAVAEGCRGMRVARAGPTRPNEVRHDESRLSEGTRAFSLRRKVPQSRIRKALGSAEPADTQDTVSCVRARALWIQDRKEEGVYGPG